MNDAAFGLSTPNHPVLEVDAPRGARLPVVLASPHSGRDYPADFLAASRLDPHTLRKSEDGYVDEIFARAVQRGAPLIKALFPRAYIDPNREAFELDPEMFEDSLPAYVNTRSPRVAAGLGTIARVVAQGEDIYRRKLRFAEVLDRVERYYHPYHRHLKRLIDETRHRYGYCILVDCHSMPSAGGSAPADASDQPIRATSAVERRRVDFVLGDCYGSACAGVVTDTAMSWLESRGWAVSRNTPYAGGYTTRHYGRPRGGVHVLQIEINRALYMDEPALRRLDYLGTLAEQMSGFVGALGAIDGRLLQPGM
ncbi:MAG: N-formylglutamate amidohydrolase [Azospirillaceae bacterium]